MPSRWLGQSVSNSVYCTEAVVSLVLLHNSWARRISYQGNDNLTVGGGLEVVLLLEVLSDVTMVIDLTVDGENDAVVGVGQGLSARLCRELLVGRAPE